MLVLQTPSLNLYASGQLIHLYREHHTGLSLLFPSAGQNLPLHNCPSLQPFHICKQRLLCWKKMQSGAAFTPFPWLLWDPRDLGGSCTYEKCLTWGSTAEKPKTGLAATC